MSSFSIEPFNLQLRVVSERLGLLIQAQSRINFRRISAELSRDDVPAKGDGFLVVTVGIGHVRRVVVAFVKYEEARKREIILMKS